MPLLLRVPLVADDDPPGWHPDTVAARGGTNRTAFEETSEALFLTSGYTYRSAAEAEAAFAGESDHFVYSRYGNPTVRMFEDRLRLLEGAEACFATASGMAAVFTSLAASLRRGDRVVAARSLFGSCYIILDEILPRWGIHTQFVDGRDLAAWEQALAEPTAAVFFESPSNPMQEIIDIENVAELSHRAGALVIVDNVFASPVLQSPLSMGADVVVYSATKHIDGQGRTLGGAILGSTKFISDQVTPFMRHTGPSLSPFNAWVLLKGLETLALRIGHQAETAQVIAERLEEEPRVKRLWYPMLPSHPQHELALRQMKGGGQVVTFELEGGKPAAFSFLDALSLVDISNNLGDAKSLITHPATTTHRRLGAAVRQSMGITDGTVRMSVGLEDPRDLLDDLLGALAALA